MYTIQIIQFYLFRKVTKNIYVASDLHLGAPNKESSLKREKIFVQWLESIEKDATIIYLVGDIFDFWFEYGKQYRRDISEY